MINEKAVKIYCRDDLSKIENYEKAIADTTQTWHLHHRLELTLDGEPALTPKQLKVHDMYYNRPYYELIFLTPSEHRRLHTKGKNHPMYGRTGENHPFYGKHHSAETRRKISESQQNISAETRRKMSEAHKGKNKGKHHTEDTRRKMSEAMKGRTPWNKGKKRKPFTEDPY